MNKAQLMTRREAMQILDTISVNSETIDKALVAMQEIIDHSMRTKLYRKQGGVYVEFPNDHCAWIKLYQEGDVTFYHLTERGEVFYTGTDARKCAEILYKMGIAHKMYPNQFMWYKQ